MDVVFFGPTIMFFMILALLLSPVRKHIGTFPSHFRMYFSDMRSIDFWGHPETSTGVPYVRVGGVRGIIAAPTSPFGLSLKIEEEEEEEEQEKRRS